MKAPSAKKHPNCLLIIALMLVFHSVECRAFSCVKNFQKDQLIKKETLKTPPKAEHAQSLIEVMGGRLGVRVPFGRLTSLLDVDPYGGRVIYENPFFRQRTRESSGDLRSGFLPEILPTTHPALWPSMYGGYKFSDYVYVPNQSTLAFFLGLKKPGISFEEAMFERNRDPNDRKRAIQTESELSKYVEAGPGWTVKPVKSTLDQWDAKQIREAKKEISERGLIEKNPIPSKENGWSRQVDGRGISLIWYREIDNLPSSIKTPNNIKLYEVVKESAQAMLVYDPKALFEKSDDIQGSEITPEMAKFFREKGIEEKNSKPTLILPVSLSAAERSPRRIADRLNNERLTKKELTDRFLKLANGSNERFGKDLAVLVGNQTIWNPTMLKEILIPKRFEDAFKAQPFLNPPFRERSGERAETSEIERLIKETSKGTYTVMIRNESEVIHSLQIRFVREWPTYSSSH